MGSSQNRGDEPSLYQARYALTRRLSSPKKPPVDFFIEFACASRVIDPGTWVRAQKTNCAWLDAAITTTETNAI
jgi:hypothetical protein